MVDGQKESGVGWEWGGPEEKDRKAWEKSHSKDSDDEIQDDNSSEENNNDGNRKRQKANKLEQFL